MHAQCGCAAARTGSGGDSLTTTCSWLEVVSDSSIGMLVPLHAQMDRAVHGLTRSMHFLT